MTTYTLPPDKADFPSGNLLMHVAGELDRIRQAGLPCYHYNPVIPHSGRFDEFRGRNLADWIVYAAAGPAHHTYARRSFLEDPANGTYLHNLAKALVGDKIHNGYYEDCVAVAAAHLCNLPDHIAARLLSDTWQLNDAEYTYTQAFYELLDDWAAIESISQPLDVEQA